MTSRSSGSGTGRTTIRSVYRNQFFLPFYFLRMRYQCEQVITIYAPMIYTAPCTVLLMWAASITWASGKGLGPWNREFWVLWFGIEPIGECHFGTKKLEIAVRWVWPLTNSWHVQWDESWIRQVIIFYFGWKLEEVLCPVRNFTFFKQNAK